MINPSNIATSGYLDSPLGIASNGYLTIELVIYNAPKKITKPSFARKDSEEIERKVYLKRKPQLIKDEEELLLILESFVICQS